MAINLDLLIRVVADQAKRELAAVAAGADTVSDAAQGVQSSGEQAGQGLDRVGTAGAEAASAIGTVATRARESAEAERDLATANTAVAGTSQAGAAGQQAVGIAADASAHALRAANQQVTIGVAEFTALAATAGRTATALAGARDGVTGLTTNMGRQVTEMLATRRETEAWQAELDGVRARFNPLFAASRQYEQELRLIAAAERDGAISAMEAAAARDRAAMAMAPLNNQMQQHVQSLGAARAANANLIAQGNDIIMMAMAGQAPLMLALQQGTQVSQIIGSVRAEGGSLSKILGGAFLGLLNPVNLATIAIIGLGAAGVQWLMSLKSETKSLEEQMKDLEATLGRVKASMDILADSRLEDRFGSMAGPVREMTRVLLELDRAAELKQLQAALDGVLKKEVDPSIWQKMGQGFVSGIAAGAGGGATAAYLAQQDLRAQNYASLNVANSYEDFQVRQSTIMAAAKRGERDVVVKEIESLAGAMTGGGAFTDMSEEAQSLLTSLGQLALKTAEIEAAFNGSAKESRLSREVNSISLAYRQQAELAQAQIAFGEDSAQVEALRSQHAREALQLRLQEAGVVAGSVREQQALADFESARAAEAQVAETRRQASIGAVIGEMTQQLSLSDAILSYGENSLQVEELRASQARDLQLARLEELGAGEDVLAQARQLLEADRRRVMAIREAATARRVDDMMAELVREAEIRRAILQHGEDSLAVKKLQIAAERDAYAQQLAAMEISEITRRNMMAQWEAARGLASADPFGVLGAGRDLMQDQQDRAAQLRLEIDLAGQSAAVRERVLALYRAEREIRDRGIDASGDMASQIRATALDNLALEQQLNRLTDAWGRVDDAAGSAIDRMVDGLTGGDLGDALRETGAELLNFWSEMALKNPLKNAMLGTDLPTMQDVGGWGGIMGRLFGAAGPQDPASGLAISSMSAASMAVTTPIVHLNAGNIAGFPAGAVGGTIHGSGIGMGPGSANVQGQIWQFFAQKGLQPHQVAAIMGNASAESAFNPLAVGDGGTSFGLFQHHAERGQGLLSAVGGQAGLGNVQAQLEYVWQELLTGERGVLQKLMAAPDVYSATQAFVGFERPQGWSAGNPTGAMHWDQRLASAEAAMAKFEGTVASAGQGLGQLGTGMQGFGASLSQMIQGVGAQHGAGGILAGGLLSGLGSLIGIPGFDRGGWTGSGHPSDVAGLVHAEEYVFDAATTRRIGVANLEAIRRGAMPGYRTGGFVTGGRPPISREAREEMAQSARAAAAPPEQQVTFNMNVSGTGDAQIMAGVQAAMQETMDYYDRNIFAGRVRMVLNDPRGE